MTKAALLSLKRISINSGVLKMQTQWYLCEIIDCPKHEEQKLKKTDNLSVKYPDTFLNSDFMAIFGQNRIEDNEKGQGDWFVWLPIIPRVGDTLQFRGWQTEVSQVILRTDFHSEKGIQEGLFVSASIKIRDNVVPHLMGSTFSIEKRNNKALNWETYASRGHDLQYYAWELRDEFYLDDKKTYYRWHSRIRPVAGDIITIEDKRWRIQSVELANANKSVDGYLTLENAD